MRWILLAAPLVLVACGPTAEEEEVARQRDIAEVEANQEPPPEQLALEPIRYREIEKYDLYGAGCSFTPDGAGLGTVALAMADKGYLIRKGELLIHAADMGSAELPYLARQKYDGREYSFTLDLDEAGGKQSGYETTDYRGELTVRDGNDNVVYQAKGPVQCGA
ncbi:hypothetical protein [Qipengyuania sphaerica]|uniref:hypothetical protein n=1 Tax=Qipengyuania sphaerica TaxID=2867243 RepID=UPI001C87283A|nr:hypothetical protein [Qipengyuania sphaerica]MBX7540756.1 hypothetical protein [Qipengyuania sphaerica]